ncbi:MAG: hypothetical protein ACPG49_06200 [Chitinophagales bacterium]
MRNKRLLQCCFFCFAALLLMTSITAQNIAPYVDNNGRFKVFDNGKMHDLEHEEVEDVKVGGDYLVYRDNIGQLKWYGKGENKHLTDDERIICYTSQFLMASNEGLKGEILKVMYGEEEELLTIDFDRNRFSIQDSVLVFIDSFGYLSIFYEGETYEISGRVTSGKNFKTSLNSVVYVDGADVFHIFHEGERTEIYHRPPNIHWFSSYLSKAPKPMIKKDPKPSFSNRPGSFEEKLAKMTPTPTTVYPDKTRLESSGGLFRALDIVPEKTRPKIERRNLTSGVNSMRYKMEKNRGRGSQGRRNSGISGVGIQKSTEPLQRPPQCHVGDDFVVFVNEMDKLMVYDEGELITLTEFRPKGYRGGDKMTAYVDIDSKFMVYWDGLIKELAPRPPRFLTVKNNTLAYVDDLGYFNVWDKGKKVTLETYQPARIAVFDGIVVYTDLDNRLKAYYEGKAMKISSEIIDDFQLVGRVLLYTIGNNKVKIFHDGKHYSG